MTTETLPLNPIYIERRLAQADADALKVDILAMQTARRHTAIDRAVRRIAGVRRLLRERVLTTAHFDELLEEIARDLEQANQTSTSINFIEKA